ncbi:PREDICTED: putative serine protease F56F10.1 [Wasmannia auropunctata]|uniref:putative serine protease F56F10.1 n=1 Tax=Wasmannia auropunctata TaxID=64793 RepID=UPI0005F003DD|nr:PREDICTED: putative serine protease F56F10.1 [Wasmannia auropunctata]
MQYLNVDQALADLAYFIETKKEENNLEKSIVIVVGGSYAGNMAAWARLKYPHLIQGALASSAPVQAKLDFYEYYEVVAKSLSRHSENCVKSVKTAFTSVEKLLTTQGGANILKHLFKPGVLCVDCVEQSTSQNQMSVNFHTRKNPHSRKLHIHRDLTEAVMDDIDKLLNEFISKNNYRASMFLIIKNK